MQTLPTDIIMYNLVQNKEYVKKVIPYIKEEYFEQEWKHLWNVYINYIRKYKKVPSVKTLEAESLKITNISDHVMSIINEQIENIKSAKDEYDIDWLVDETERWAYTRAMENAIIKSATFFEENRLDKFGEIEQLVKDALSVSFNSDIGMEFDDSSSIDKRWKKYKSPTAKYSTGIKRLDDVCNGGFEDKALSVFMGDTGTGKTVALCQMAKNMLLDGHNVLYITLEMSEEKITQRIESNIFDVAINDIPLIEEKSDYVSHFEKFKTKNAGRLIVKEYPPTTLSVFGINHLLDELRLKKDFIPKILIVDYINLMVSTRIKNDNTYNTIKAVAEELRGIMVSEQFVGISATQSGRSGHNTTDIHTDQVSESYGLPQTTDLFIGQVFPEELREQNVQIWKILKNRFGGEVNIKFPVKVDFEKSRFTDADKETSMMFDQTDVGKNSALQNAISTKNEFKNKISFNSVVDDEDDMMKFLD